MPGPLAAKIRAKYPGAYDGIDDATLEKQVIAKYPQYASLAEPEDAPQPPQERTWTDTAVDALPMLGGAVGGILGTAGGPVGAMGGAALGGGGGEAFKQLVNRARGADAPDFPMAAAKDIGVSGAVQGAIEGVTGLGGRLLTRGASRLYQSALKPSVAIRADAPNVVQVGLREGIPVTARGTGKAGRLLTTSRQAADDMLAAAEQAGVAGVPTERLTASLMGKPTQTAARRTQLGVTGMHGSLPGEAVAARGAAIRTAGRGDIPLTRAQALKREAQDLAYEASKNNLSLEQQTNAAVARALRSGIERRVPAVAPINQRTQDLIGLTRALEAAEGRIGNNLPQMVGARGAMSALAGGGTYAATGDPTLAGAVAGGSMLLSNPGSASNIARLMNRTGQATQSRMTPQAIRAALLATLAGDE